MTFHSFQSFPYILEIPKFSFKFEKNIYIKKIDAVLIEDLNDQIKKWQNNIINNKKSEVKCSNIIVIIRKKKKGCQWFITNEF